MWGINFNHTHTPEPGGIPGFPNRARACEYETNELAKDLNQLFEKKVEVPRIRAGKRQKVVTLIKEEILLLAKFLRNEQKTWIPRFSTIR